MRYRINNFPVLYQKPELPTGCEITALAMVLHFYGYPVDKTVLAASFLPRTDEIIQRDRDGRRCGPDLDHCFVGDPFGRGTVCGSEAIASAANAYFLSCGSRRWAVDAAGTDPEDLYLCILQNRPVIVLVTIGMENRRKTEGWYTKAGKYVEWSTNDHGAVLIGWSKKTVEIACPLYGLRTYSRAQFEKVYADRGKKAVLVI